MLHKWLFALALTLLLGFSQQGALLHGISHLADLDPITQQQDQAPQHASYCEHCLSIGHFAHALVSHHHFDTSPVSHQASFLTEAQPHTTAFVRNYAARAPPHLI